MIDDIMKIVDKAVRVFKKPIYGKTFFCPVCHLELSYYDLDKNGCCVCPVCGVVIEVKTTYGHSIPVVNDVEINRVQPKMRIHPVATHLPIGLFPLAILGAIILLFSSVWNMFDPSAKECQLLSSISDITLIFFALATVGSVVTFLSGLYDWKYRYGQRPYRAITLKIYLSFAFILTGAGITALHCTVFDTAGFIDFSTPAILASTIAYYALQGLGMIFMATLGHVGGYLVYGK